ncbi:MAG: hypothetical protein H6877_08645 [Rhodobiaceae bacterium]|nr:hypothetical protein [Rhodobiaceae bacterium]
MCERAVFREFFPRGMTALDPIEEETLGSRPSLAHLAARREIRRLIDQLRLPVDERGKRRAEARRMGSRVAASRSNWATCFPDRS